MAGERQFSLKGDADARVGLTAGVVSKGGNKRRWAKPTPVAGMANELVFSVVCRKVSTPVPTGQRAEF